jgi:hypothetical protein
MASEALEVCQGCGVALAPCAGATHPYMLSSPSCWALFGDVLGREYLDPVRMAVHKLTVDAYAVQHPGRNEPRAVRSVWGHLASLYWQIERQAPPEIARRAIAAVAAVADKLGWMEPPAPASLTVADVAAAGDASEHCASVRRWAEAVWNAWGDQHPRIAQVAEQEAKRAGWS